MNKIIFLILLNLVLLPTNCLSQGITNEEKQRIIADLDSSDYMTRFWAIDAIGRYEIIEAVPKLESIFWQQEPQLQGSILLRLIDLNPENLYQLTKAFLDSVPNYNYESTMITPLDLQITATYILFSYGDYSTVEYVFQIIERDKPKNQIDPLAKSLLPKIIENVPEYAEQAKEELIYLVNNQSTRYSDRTLSLLYLSEIYGQEILPLIETSFTTDQDPIVRISAFELLFLYNDPNLNQLLKDRLFSDPEPTVRYKLATALLDSFGTPSDYIFVTDYLQREPNDTIKSVIQFEIETYRPPVPDSAKPTLDLFDNLKNYVDSVYNYTWLGDEQFKNELQSILQSAKSNLQNGDSLACRVQVKAFQDLVDNVYKDSLNTDPRFVTIEGWKFLYWNAQYILDRLPEPPANPNLLVKLTNSQGVLIPASNVQYYEGSWKDAVNNGDGTFTVITTKPKVSIRVYYEYASLQADNITAQNNTYTFQTVKCAVQLKNSQGEFIDTGTVQYYAGAWRSFGTTTNGVATKELLPINYSFRMTYEYGSIDKQQNLSVDPTVIFQTVNAQVQLKNSLGNLMPAPMGDVGTVQYYAGAWRTFGTTVNGVATKELLPINYSFRMTYAYASIDKQQNLSTDPIVVFQTVNAAVRLKNSLGNLIDTGTVQYYAGAWRSFGTTTNGVATKELLPLNYSFRMTYEYVSKDKQQNLSTNPVVDFNTVLCSVKVSKTSNNQPLNNAAVKYYAGAWRNLGTTNQSGITTKELLPANISFRASYGNVSADKQQDINTNNLVEFLLNVP